MPHLVLVFGGVSAETCGPLLVAMKSEGLNPRIVNFDAEGDVEDAAGLEVAMTRSARERFGSSFEWDDSPRHEQLRAELKTEILREGLGGENPCSIAATVYPLARPGGSAGWIWVTRLIPSGIACYEVQQDPRLGWAESTRLVGSGFGEILT